MMLEHLAALLHKSVEIWVFREAADRALQQPHSPSAHTELPTHHEEGLLLLAQHCAAKEAQLCLATHCPLPTAGLY